MALREQPKGEKTIDDEKKKRLEVKNWFLHPVGKLTNLSNREAVESVGTQRKTLIPLKDYWNWIPGIQAIGKPKLGAWGNSLFKVLSGSLKIRGVR